MSSKLTAPATTAWSNIHCELRVRTFTFARAGHASRSTSSTKFTCFRRRRSTRCSRRWRSRRRTSSSSSPPPRRRRSRSRSCRAVSVSTSAASACRASSTRLQRNRRRRGDASRRRSSSSLVACRCRRLDARRAIAARSAPLLQWAKADGGQRPQPARHCPRGAASPPWALPPSWLQGCQAGARDCSTTSSNQGQQLGELLDQLIEYWRDLMVVNSAAGLVGQSVSVSSAPSADRTRAARQAKANLDTILAGMRHPGDGEVAHAHRSSHGRAILEMALVRLGQAGGFAADRADPCAMAQQGRVRFASRRRDLQTRPTRPAPRAVLNPPQQGAQAAESEKKLTPDDSRFPSTCCRFVFEAAIRLASDLAASP